MTRILPRLKWRKLIKNKFRFAPHALKPLPPLIKERNHSPLGAGQEVAACKTDVNLTCPLLVRHTECKEVKLGGGSVIYSVY